MATSGNLMALSMNSQLARVLGNGPYELSCAGSSVGDATVVNMDMKTVVVNASNGGNGIVFTTCGASNALLPGDRVTVANTGSVGASVIMYLANSAKFIGNGVSIAGATGLSVAVGRTVDVIPVNADLWLYSKVSA